MAVYERTYRRYTGELNSVRSRPFVLTRDAFRDVFRGRILLAYFVLCFIWPLACAAVIYLRHNATFLEAFPQIDFDKLLQLDGGFFMLFLRVQGVLMFLFTLFAGPGLVSRDLANNGLALYLARPLTRRGYVLGKLLVLLPLQSAMTWVVGLLLVALQTAYAGREWLATHWQVATGMVLGSLIWALLLALIALAASAWVRWRPIAAFSMFMLWMAGQFFATTINHLFDTIYGSVFDLSAIIKVIWSSLLGLEISAGKDLSIVVAWVALAAWIGLALLLLDRRIRAYEEVR